MATLLSTPLLDKRALINRIKENFLHINEFKYYCTSAEFTNDQGEFIGDNFWETVFKPRPNKSPIIYEFGGPYDTFSNEYGEAGRVWNKGHIVFEVDMKNGVIQRTAAMATAYLQEIAHSPVNILFYGTGKVNSSVLDYIKYFFADIKTADYVIHKAENVDFTTQAQSLGIASTGVQTPDFSKYDTIIMAKNKDGYVLTSETIQKLSSGTVLLSLSTTGTADIAPDVYKNPVIDVFIDQENTKSSFSDMKEAIQNGYLKSSTEFSTVIKEERVKNPSKITIIRLTGTPLQDIAVIEMMLTQAQIIID